MDVLSLLQRHPADRPAIGAPGRDWLTYGGLRDQVHAVIDTLRAHGIGRGDRVAYVLPNGPELAVTFLAVSSGAAAAPLNPRYREPEFDFYLSDLGARLLIVRDDYDGDALPVAEKHGIRVLRLSVPEGARAGAYTLSGEAGAEPSTDGPNEPDDVALVLHTSGTTSRPKIVPLRARNITRSAENIRESLALTPDDRCLNVMPLFHVHGLMGALLSSMAAGGSVVCSPGFFATDFFGWMAAFEPTWYTAVPTMHQALLQRREGIPAAHRMRFIRSCSASLPPSVMADLEGAFGVPVVEAYGMTEAAHQISINPLPPGERKPGTVGLPTGVVVGIMDEEGNLLPAGQRGEIVLKGASVTDGYENNPEANAASFTEGWFRTGDQGVIDEAGYVTITGRIKELINRAGEKVSPREVDEVLLTHPEVVQAVAFAMPDERLGEEVAAAVILREGAELDARDLREFAAEQLADFKVPRHILFVDEVPKGPTGKLQRIGLAEKLGLVAEPLPEPGGYVAPRTPVEEMLAAVWADVLRRDTVGVRDEFTALGGDSMLATRVVTRVREQLGVDVTLRDFFDTPTIESMAPVIEDRLFAADDQSLG
ncbi:MAG: AMP-binding protein [Chloroflexi bacterium]|nr:AMP-binding protein [Chloroflexota bacterium]